MTRYSRGSSGSCIDEERFADSERTGCGERVALGEEGRTARLRFTRIQDVWSDTRKMYHDRKESLNHSYKVVKGVLHCIESPCGM